MKIILMLFVFAVLFMQCKKKEKLENPLGLLALGSDTSLDDGRYLIRTKYGCSGYANILSCDNADEVLSMNNALYPTDHVRDMDSLAVWYVKKVRYVSPDPDYALAFAYRIYQYRPNGAGYRFLSIYSMASPGKDNVDEVGDGGGESCKVKILQKENFPADPPVPTSLGTSTEPEVPDTRFTFQFYPSKNNPGFRLVKVGGHGSPGTTPQNRWKLCTGYWDEPSCDGNALPLHFRSEYDDCELVDAGGGASTRCYVDEFVFEKVYQ